MTIRIDLNNLTQKDFDIARANMNGAEGCNYAAPCIIGTLMPEGVRGPFDELGTSTIAYLMRNDLVSVPEDQQHDAILMQSAFDSASLNRLAELVRKYVPDL